MRGTGKLSSYTIIYQPVDAVLSYDVDKALKSSPYTSYMLKKNLIFHPVVHRVSLWLIANTI